MSKQQHVNTNTNTNTNSNANTKANAVIQANATVKPCLAFSAHAEEALDLYVSTFKGSRIKSVVRAEAGGPLPAGQLLHASFELNGQEYTAMNGGPTFKFSEGISLVATVDTQEELDAVWNKLTSDGGKEGPCGWLTDKFGVSWQVVPRALGEMMSNAQGGNTQKVMGALMQMKKLDVATLERAYRS